MVFLLAVYRLYVPHQVVLPEGLAAVGAALGGPLATRSLTGGGLVTTCSHTTRVRNILNLLTAIIPVNNGKDITVSQIKHVQRVVLRREVMYSKVK